MTDLQIVLRDGAMSSVLWCSDWARITELCPETLAEVWEGPVRSPYRAPAYYPVCDRCGKPGNAHRMRHPFVPRGFQECGEHGWFLGFPDGCPVCLEDKKREDPDYYRVFRT